MLDPALIGLIGVGIGGIIGAGGTTLAALITTGRTRKDKRRELQLSAYAQGMAAVSGFGNCNNLEDVRATQARLLEARLHIRLVGSTQTSDAFDRHAELTAFFLDQLHAEATKAVSFKSAERRTREAIPAAKEKEFTDTHKAFIDAARRDLGIPGWD
ncbi:hypothetical protein ACTG9Q_24775 [Actinokineospora sp. 24-640]